MQNPFHKLTLGGILTTAAAVAVQAYDPSVVSPKVAGIVGIAGLVTTILGNVLHTNKQSQAITALTDAVQQIAQKQAGQR